MATVGIATLLSSDIFPPFFLFLSFPVLIGSWFWEPPLVAFERYEAAWKLLSLLVIFALFLLLVMGAQSLLISGSYLILFLSLNKLFNRKSSKDYQQVYILSFLQMIASSVLNTGLTFAIFFLLYIVSMTWTLILFHLKREMEENYLLKYGDSLHGRPVQVQRVLNSKKLVGREFLLSTCLISLFIFGGACLLFLSFPRVSLSKIFKKRRPGVQMSGFSDQIELGHFGLLKENPSVVMRVEFSKPEERHSLPLYWRGLAFDHYDGQRWSQSIKEQSFALRGSPKFIHCPQGRSRCLEASVLQSVYLEPMEEHLLFGLQQLKALRLEQNDLEAEGLRLRMDLYGAIYYERFDELSVRYQVYSAPQMLHSVSLQEPLKRYQAQQQRDDPYLQLPPLSPLIPALAEDMIAGTERLDEVITRVEQGLKRRYQYTTNLKRDKRLPPLEDFLFEQRQGHCEYFSTAMVILLRTQGIAARIVNGFYGGVWNSYGRYLAIRQGDAHSWVEVRLSNGQWVRRDPTPNARTAPRTLSFWEHLLQYSDALRLRWYKYVIEYDLQGQLQLLKELQERWSDLPEISFPKLSLLLLLLPLLPLSLRWRSKIRQAQRPEVQREAISKLYLEMLEIYTKLGFARRDSMTPGEFLERLRQGAAPGLELADEICAFYERVRFGAEPLEWEQLQRCRKQLKSFKRSGA